MVQERVTPRLSCVPPKVRGPVLKLFSDAIEKEKNPLKKQGMTLLHTVIKNAPSCKPVEEQELVAAAAGAAAADVGATPAEVAANPGEVLDRAGHAITAGAVQERRAAVQYQSCAERVRNALQTAWRQEFNDFNYSTPTVRSQVLDALGEASVSTPAPMHEALFSKAIEGKLLGPDSTPLRCHIKEGQTAVDAMDEDEPEKSPTLPELLAYAGPGAGPATQEEPSATPVERVSKAIRTQKREVKAAKVLSEKQAVEALAAKAGAEQRAKLKARGVTPRDEKGRIISKARQESEAAQKLTAARKKHAAAAPAAAPKVETAPAADMTKLSDEEAQLTAFLAQVGA